MTLATTTGQKRKRSDGFAMPKLRDVVDPDTGEVYHVETTRQAKRRHRRNADFYNKPTIGQINAAEIWNKQEEKIKKDKERAVKRKKNKLKQEKKDARQKEVQEQMLKEGKITIEDTWGKVTSSQNRLHKFFGVAPKQANKGAGGDQEKFLDDEHISEDDDDDTDISDDYTEETVEDDVWVVEEEDTSNVLDQPLDEKMDTETFLQGISFEGDLEAIFTNSPLSPEKTKVQDQTRTDFQHQPNVVPQDNQDQVKRRVVRMSQLMMPPQQPGQTPPKKDGFYSAQSSDEILDDTPTELADFIKALPKPTPKPDSDAVSAQKHRSVKDASYGENNFFLGTQMINDTLQGLCSQDFSDDFGKCGNAAKSSHKIISPRPATVNAEKLWEQAVEQNEEVSSRAASDTTFETVLEGFDSEELDDVGIDDETLLALAATQQLNRELLTHSAKKQPAVSVPIFDDNNDNDHSVSKQNIVATDLPVTELEFSDSFGASAYNDSDLLRGLDDFENHNYLKGTKIPEFIPSKTARPQKPKRVLPWIKNPVGPDVRGDTPADPIPISSLSPTLRK